MGSETNLRLPVIDFSSKDLKPGTPVWERAKSQVREAAEDYGCFEALFKIIPQDLRKAMDEALEEVFALPLENKKRNVSEKPFHGYIGSSSPMSLYESIGFDDPDYYKEVERFANIMWPEGNTNFRFISFFLMEILYIVFPLLMNFIFLQQNSALLLQNIIRIRSNNKENDCGELWYREIFGGTHELNVQFSQGDQI